ncbi:MAG: M28 family peptidase [Candidatus Aminicenantes bacterium]|nr:M28 family peptidase [Candidatus Aminicenantes bacterium]
MKLRNFFSVFVIMCVLMSGIHPVYAQKKGMESITKRELGVHLKFLSSDEMRGRDTPSNELRIASRYIATFVESYGFKPLMPNGSFFQEVPLKITTVNRAEMRVPMDSGVGEKVFTFPEDFGVNTSRDGMYIPRGFFEGEIVFVGLGLHAPDLEWLDYEDLDLKGKIVVMLDPDTSDIDFITKENFIKMYLRPRVAIGKGAVAVLSVIGEKIEKDFAENGYCFDITERAKVIREKTSSIKEGAHNLRAEIRHDVAAALLGISRAELSDMFAAIREGKRVPGKEFPGKKIQISIDAHQRIGNTRNVVAVLEGKDKKLRDEYVLFGSHHDHVGALGSTVWNGADDNASAAVAMLEIAQAMVVERPKRSVIMVWHTGEEKGLWGAYHFVENSPVPVGKMSAEINMDMISRNDPNGIYLIGSDMISTELDAAFHKMNDRYTKLKIDYTYNTKTHPERWYYRSDHLPYAQVGVPAVWVFCGATEDYHQPTDTFERADLSKMEKVTRLVYLTGYEIGNMKDLLKLDADPKITSRGKQNLKKDK